MLVLAATGTEEIDEPEGSRGDTELTTSVADPFDANELEGSRGDTELTTSVADFSINSDDSSLLSTDRHPWRPVNYCYQVSYPIIILLL